MTRNEVLQISAPIIAMGGVWVVQRAMRGGYRAATGNAPPAADDLDVPVGRVILFAASAAVLAAVVNVVVTRQVAKAAHPHDQLPEGM